MGEELRKHIFFFAEGDHAVAQVAGRKHIEVFAQAARGTAIVGDGYNRREIGRSGTVSALASQGRLTWRRSPRNSVERPVPPPMATTRNGGGMDMPSSSSDA